MEQINNMVERAYNKAEKSQKRLTLKQWQKLGEWLMKADYEQLRGIKITVDTFLEAEK